MRSPVLSKQRFFQWADAQWSRTATNEANPYECGRWIVLVGKLSCCVVAFFSGKSDELVRMWVDGLPTIEALKARERILHDYEASRRNKQE